MDSPPYALERSEVQRKIDEQILALRESQATYAQERREAQRKIDQEILALKEAQAKTDEQMRRTDAKLDRIGQQLRDLGLVQEEVAEDLPCYPFSSLTLH